MGVQELGRGGVNDDTARHKAGSRVSWEGDSPLGRDHEETPVGVDTVLAETGLGECQALCPGPPSLPCLVPSLLTGRTPSRRVGL